MKGLKYDKYVKEGLVGKTQAVRVECAANRNEGIVQIHAAIYRNCVMLVFILIVGRGSIRVALMYIFNYFC